MALEIAPLINATTRLREGLGHDNLYPSNEYIRDRLMQRFEFTCEVRHKMFKWHLEANAASPGQFDAVTSADLIRTGNEPGLLKGDWPVYKRCKEMRAQTGDMHDEGIADSVVGGMADAFSESDLRWKVDVLD